MAFDGPTPLLGSLAPDAAIISFSSLSKAYLAPGWRTGWIVVGGSDRMDDVLAAIKKMADGRLCSPGTDAVRDRASALRRSLAPARVLRGAPRARRAHDAADLRDSRDALRDAARGFLRDAAGRSSAWAAPTRTTSSGCSATTGNLCVYGSGFGMPAEDGYFRIVFLAAPEILNTIYDEMAEFTRDFLAR